MNTQLFRAVFAVVAVIGMTIAAAGGGADPIVGTWVLDASQSQFAAGPALASQTRTYTQSGPNISLVMKTATADGKESATKTTYQLDGKDYPVTGSMDYDSLSGKQLNSHSAEFVLKKGGKKIGTTTRTVSADGKTMTSKMTVTLAAGEKANQTLVFHKQ